MCADVGKKLRRAVSSDDEWLERDLLSRSKTKTSERQLQLNSSDEQWLEDLCRVRRHVEAADDKSKKVETVDDKRNKVETADDKSKKVSIDTVMLPWERLAEKAENLSQNDIIDFLAAAGEIPLPHVAWPPMNSIITESLVRSVNFEYCLSRWAAWQRAHGWLLTFKVGIAFDYDHRWWNKKFGYVAERRWHFMDVMCSDESKNIRDLEFQLVRCLKHFPGCQNDADGGGGISPNTPGTCHCYMVFAKAGDGVGLEIAWKEACEPLPMSQQLYFYSMWLWSSCGSSPW